MKLPEWLLNLLITLAARRLVRLTRKALKYGTVRDIQDVVAAYRDLAREHPQLVEASNIADRIENGYGLGSIEAFVLEREGVIDSDKQL